MMKLNADLLNLILYIQKLKDCLTARNILLEEHKDWFQIVENQFNNLPDSVFQNAGISKCRHNVESALNFIVHEKMLNCDEDELHRFSAAGFYPYLSAAEKATLKETPKDMVYISPRGKPIRFEHFEDGGTFDSPGSATYWAKMCIHHRNQYKSILGNRLDPSASGVCSVAGCSREADYYVDFDDSEVKFVDANGDLEDKSQA